MVPKMQTRLPVVHVRSKFAKRNIMIILNALLARAVQRTNDLAKVHIIEHARCTKTYRNHFGFDAESTKGEHLLSTASEHEWVAVLSEEIINTIL